MTPRYALIGLAAMLTILASLAGLDSCRRGRGASSEVQAHIADGEARTHEAQARTQDARIQNLQAKHLEDQKELGRLSAERSALLRKLEDERAKRVDPGQPTDSESVPDLHDSVIAKDAEVIQAQAYFIEGQKAEIAALTISRDEWKATAEARERQALAQEVATRAWKDAVSSSRWFGRVEGFAAGLALGYVGGRR